jgi:hypothetical protein
MSIFNPVAVSCPSCGAPVDFNAVYSLNADRRKDLRAAVLDGSFQREACSRCNTVFRLDPEFTYVDVGRGLWVAVHPYGKLGHWKPLEEQARATFDKAYGAGASAAAREIGKGIKARVTFGWAALREKLVAGEAGLDDLVLELAKTAIIRGIDNAPLGTGTELRLANVDGDQLAVAWINGANEELKEILRVPRTLYDGIAADLTPWAALQTSLSAGPFVDMNRLLVASPS